MSFIGIVGADASKWNNVYQRAVAKRLIQQILMLKRMEYKRIVLVSGGCPKGGIDIWAESIADDMNIPTLIFSPEGKGWKYYKARNIKITENSDEIHDIEPNYNRSGGGWTFDYFKEHYPNRVAQQYVISEDMIIRNGILVKGNRILGETR